MNTETIIDSRLKSRKETARTVLWICSAGLVVFLLILHAPRAVELAGARARKMEEEADRLLDSDPSRRIVLYRSALSLSMEQEHITTLKEKMGFLDRRLTPGPASTGAERTVAFSERSGEAPLNHTASCIGPDGRYCMRGLLGSGAMGVTHRAYDMVLDREVAIKELLPGLALDEELVSRFRNEARVLAGLSHPCIVQVYDFLEEAGHMWIVMELLRGSELADLIREKGMITVAEVTRIGLQMAEAMGYAHARGVVHRDFKPSNVMLTPGGSTKITDFGLARLTRTSVYTEEGIVLGTPYYMSPEQAEGRVADQRSDIYSMGVVLYQMLTGRVPFEGENMASILEKHIHEEPTPPSRIASGIPQELESLLLTMLSKDPEKRLQDMKAIAEVLGKYTRKT